MLGLGKNLTVTILIARFLFPQNPEYPLPPKDTLMKKTDLPEISPKNTKEQILTAYSEVLEKLNEKNNDCQSDNRITDRKQQCKNLACFRQDNIELI